LTTPFFFPVVLVEFLLDLFPDKGCFSPPLSTTSIRLFLACNFPLSLDAVLCVTPTFGRPLQIGPLFCSRLFFFFFKANPPPGVFSGRTGLSPDSRGFQRFLDLAVLRGSPSCDALLSLHSLVQSFFLTLFLAILDFSPRFWPS